MNNMSQSAPVVATSCCCLRFPYQEALREALAVRLYLSSYAQARLPTMLKFSRTPPRLRSTRMLTPTPLAGLRHSHKLHCLCLCLCLLSGLDIALAYLNMATPYRPSDSNNGPSGRMLRQLLAEIDGVQSSQTVQLPEDDAGPKSPPVHHTASAWVGGSSLAQDVREKLRAADTARWRRTSVNIVDGIFDPASPALRSESSGPEFQDATVDGRAEGTDAGSDHSPDPVKDPYDHIKHAMQGSPISTTDDLASSDGSKKITPSYFQASSSSEPVPSPPMFLDVSLDDLSSSTTDIETSPNEALSSATTTDTSAQPQSFETGMSSPIDEVSQRRLQLNNTQRANEGHTSSTIQHQSLWLRSDQQRL